MSKQLYEVNWLIFTDVCQFLKKDLKVFSDLSEAELYGKAEEINLNDGLPYTDKIDDGYCYKYISAREIEIIDGYPINLIS